MDVEVHRDVILAAVDTLPRRLQCALLARGGLEGTVEVLRPPELVQRAGVAAVDVAGVSHRVCSELQPREAAAGDVGVAVFGLRHRGQRAGARGRRDDRRRDDGTAVLLLLQRADVEAAPLQVARPWQRRRRHPVAGDGPVHVHGRELRHAVQHWPLERRRRLDWCSGRDEIDVPKHGAAADGGGAGRRRRRGRLGERLVGGGVDAALPEPLLDVRVPKVLDLVVRPARQLRRNLRPPGHVNHHAHRVIRFSLASSIVARHAWQYICKLTSKS